MAEHAKPTTVRAHASPTKPEGPDRGSVGASLNPGWFAMGTHLPGVGASACACAGADEPCPKCARGQAKRQPGVGEGPVGPTPALGSGRPLDSQTRRHFDRSFGFDFSSVRVHTDDAANQATRAERAHALTYGHDIAFRADRYRPQQPAGAHLLAHELAHVVQQTGGAGSGPPDLGHEREADHAASLALAGRDVGSLRAAAPGVQRWPDGEPTTPPPIVAPESLARPEREPVGPIAPDRRMWFRSLMFANDEAYLQRLLEGHMARHGTEATQRLVAEFVRTGGRDELIGGVVPFPPLSAHAYGARRPLVRSPYDVVVEERARSARDVVLEREGSEIAEKLQRLLAQLLRDREQFLGRFRTRAGGTLRELLQRGEADLREQAVRYGIEQHEHVRRVTHHDGYARVTETEVTTSYTMENTIDAQGLAGAAQDLLAKRDELIAIGTRRSALMRTRSLGRGGSQQYVPPENQVAYDRIGREFEAKQAELQLLQRIHGRSYPMLAPFVDDIGALRQFARGSSVGTARRLGEHIWERLGQVAAARSDLASGRVDVWKLPQVLELTKSTAGLQANTLEARWVDEQRDQTRERDELHDTILTVLGLVLALVATVATAGTALAVVAAVGSVAVSGMSLARAVERYELERADNYADRAYAVCGNDPSSLWIALEVVGLVLDVYQAAAAFRAIMPAARRAARAAASEAASATDEVVELAEAQRAGLGNRMRDAIGRARQAEGLDPARALAGAAGHEASAVRSATTALTHEADAAGTVVRPMSVGPHSIKITPGGHIARCSICGFLRSEYAAEIGASLAEDGALAGRVAHAEELARQAAAARTAGQGARAQQLAEQAATEASAVADQLELARRVRLAVEGGETAADVARAARGLAEGVDPHLFDEALRQIPEGLRHHLAADARLQRALMNADYNPRRLIDAWEHYWNTPALRSGDFVEYLSRHPGFVTSATHVNRPLTEVISGWATMSAPQRARALLGQAEPTLLARLQAGTLPEHIAQRLRGILDDEAVITRVIGGAEQIDGPRRELMRRLNQELALAARDPADFATLVQVIESPANRGSMGEWFAEHRLVGAGSDSAMHARFPREDVPGLNRSPFVPDRVNPTTHRTIDVKTGYADTEIDVLQAQDYATLRRASAANPALAERVGGALQGHDYLFLPVGTRSAEDAAARAWALLDRRNLLEETRVLYVGADNQIYRYTGYMSPPQLIGPRL